MKKLSITLAIMGMTSFAFAQDPSPEYAGNFLEMRPMHSNDAYLRKVQNDFTPNQVKFLENLVSNWDVAKAEKINGFKNQPYEATFSSRLGYIAATFERDGKILTANERFKNVSIPKQLQFSIAKQYPDWHIVKNTYSSQYAKDKEPKRHLMVLMKKGNLKKRLKINLTEKLA